MSVRERFTRLSTWASKASGSPFAFGLALVLLTAWAAAGPPTHYSDSWMLWINTGTTIYTWLQVILVQHTQNRDMVEVRTLIRELVRAVPEADTTMIQTVQDEPEDEE